MSGDELTAEVNRLTGQADTLKAELSAALDRAARADSFRADADRVSREAEDSLSGHADTLMRRTQRADTLAAEVSALTNRLNDSLTLIAALTAERDRAVTAAKDLSARVSAARTPAGQGVRPTLTIAAQTYAYVIALANAWRDYMNQHGGMTEIEWQLMKELPTYRENVKANTPNLDTYAMYLLTRYIQRFRNAKAQGRPVPDFYEDSVKWQNQLNAFFTLPVKPPTKKTYKFPATFPKAGPTS